MLHHTLVDLLQRLVLAAEFANYLLQAEISNLDELFLVRSRHVLLQVPDLHFEHRAGRMSHDRVLEAVVLFLEQLLSDPVDGAFSAESDTLERIADKAVILQTSAYSFDHVFVLERLEMLILQLLGHEVLVVEVLLFLLSLLKCRIVFILKSVEYVLGVGAHEVAFSFKEQEHVLGCVALGYEFVSRHNGVDLDALNKPLLDGGKEVIEPSHVLEGPLDGLH